MTQVLSLADAIADYVHDGDSVAMEGFTHLIPFAAGHEVIRQGKRDLTLIRMTPDLLYDQLIGMGCARKSCASPERSWGRPTDPAILARVPSLGREWPGSISCTRST